MMFGDKGRLDPIDTASIFSRCLSTRSIWRKTFSSSRQHASGSSWITIRLRGRVLKNPEDALSDQLRDAQSYEAWRDTARQLDIILNNDRWRADPASTDYDHKLIALRLQHLRYARETNDISNMIYRLRSGLLRNLGGVGDAKLFSRSLLGTKYLIEDYTEEVVAQLELIAQTDSEAFSFQSKLDFFTDTRQSFGNTALLLQGGATFGLFHLGVVKCLNQHHLLPRIISGTSVGALIAALVCIHTDEELPLIFEPSGINLAAFARVGLKGSIRRKLVRLIRQGVLMNVSVLEDCVRANVGDITFEEAYAKTKRILNIVVSSTRKNEVPRLLNYVTAPNVLIGSAACASCAITGLYDTVPLLAKDRYNNIVPWNQSAIKWSDASNDSESPVTRLAELFNVNHIILSQANPYLLPFTTKRLRPQKHGFGYKLTSLLTSEIKHRLSQLEELGLLPGLLKSMADTETQGHITILPDVNFKDYSIVLSNPTSATLEHWMKKGEQATWPKLAIIKNRCAIEQALDRILLGLRSRRTPSTQLKPQ